jgi:hypothetical protein
MSTMMLIRSKLAAQLLSSIGEADYIEGLADDVKALAEANEDQDNTEVTQVIKLYEWLEIARKEYLDLRAEINEFLERAEQEADSAP